METDLTAYVADFKLLSKPGKSMSVYDYFILGDTSFNFN